MTRLAKKRAYARKARALTREACREIVARARVRGMSSRALGRAVGLDESQLSHVCAGRRSLSLPALLALGEQVGVDVSAAITEAFVSNERGQT